MSEENAVRAAPAPRTVTTLRTDLAALGVQAGMTLLVHSSLSALGWVAGGAEAVLLALADTLGPEGTLVLPAFSSGNSDPRHWQAPPIPEEWWPSVRDEMPPFDERRTPTRGVGAIPECFRSWPGVRRSSHPATSFCALGAAADEITRGHSLDEALGEGSPLARIYERGGHVLLLGVGHGNNTSLHLSEYRAKWSSKRYIEQGGAVYVDGARAWIAYLDIALCDDDFERIGADFEETGGGARIGRVGSAESRLMPQRSLVDFGVAWMERHRG
jgi:aminoglycoside 3-N-acetyltransferase